MRTFFLVVCAALLTACPKADPIVDGSMPVATISVSAPVPSATASISKAIPESPTSIVERWNDAHVKHDATALEQLYASHIYFYGQKLTNRSCAAAKKAAFAKDASYTQSIRDLKVQTISPGMQQVRFIKTSVSNGKSTDYPSAIVVDSHGLITLETDDVSEKNLAAIASAQNGEWCLVAGGVDEPNANIQAPFKVSAQRAHEGAMRSKLFQRDQASQPTHMIAIDIIRCPATTCDRAAHECAFDMRVADLTNRDLYPSILVDWLHVDAFDGTLTSDSLSASEALPAEEKK